MNLLEQAYDHIVSELARLDKERELLENTPCACGHEWHQHRRNWISNGQRRQRSSRCWYRRCDCKQFTEPT